MSKSQADILRDKAYEYQNNKFKGWITYIDNSLEMAAARGHFAININASELAEANNHPVCNYNLRELKEYYESKGFRADAYSDYITISFGLK